MVAFYVSQGGPVSASVGWSEYEIVSKFLFNNFHAKNFEFVFDLEFLLQLRRRERRTIGRSRGR